MMLLLSSFPLLALGISNGLGRTPPMGWRSWNCYHREVTQEKMITAANAMVDRSRGVSLLEVGYENCGLDDYYQACGTGAGGSFHNASGYPLIDKTKFPDMRGMTDHAHSIGLKMGWYANNCGCSEHQTVASWGPAVTTGALPFGKGPLNDGINHYIGEVQATIDFGFDGIKLDGCGEFLNLTEFAELLNKTGKPILIENCHWGRDGPGDWGDGGDLNRGGDAVDPSHWCPFNFFRTSGDISSNFGSMMRNLASVVKHQPWNGTPQEVRTGPGCWAYPDMLEVGNLQTFEEDRTHFGAWCIASAPLILGHDLGNNDTNDKIWPIITNKDAISVSQSFAEGDKMHPGGLVASMDCSGPEPSSKMYLWGVDPEQAGSGWSMGAVGVAAPIKHEPSGLCIDAADGGAEKQGTEFDLVPCNGGDSQSFVLEANGNLHAAKTPNKLCLAIENFEGAGVVSYSCNKGENEEFIFDSDKKNICSKGDLVHKARCLDARPQVPQGGGGGDIQIWAKPQPKGATAVLVINSASNTCSGVDIDFGAVRFIPGAAAATVKDIWNGTSAALKAGASGFSTDAIKSHDSRFYLFSPSS